MILSFSLTAPFRTPSTVLLEPDVIALLARYSEYLVSCRLLADEGATGSIARSSKKLYKSCNARSRIKINTTPAAVEFRAQVLLRI